MSFVGVGPVQLSSKMVQPAKVNPTAAGTLHIAHGLLGNAFNWATASRALLGHPLLQDKIRHAQLLDMRNHGASPHSPNHTNAALASDLEKVVLDGQRALERDFGTPAQREACSTKNSILVGHSMGALVTMGTLLRRANEEALLPDSVDDIVNPTKNKHLFGDWAVERRMKCSAGMRAVNELYGFAPSQPIRDILYESLCDHRGDGSLGNIASRIPTLGRVSAAVIVDVTPTMRLGEQRSSSDNVHQTLERMTRVDLHHIHSFEEAHEELLRVGMEDKMMRDFVSTNIVLNYKDKTAPAKWKCNLDVLAKDYGSFQPSIVRWFTSAAAAAEGPSIRKPVPCTLPVLFVFGGKSPYNEPEHRKQIELMFPRAVQVVVDGAGHFVHYEKAKEFVEAVAPFIAEHL